MPRLTRKASLNAAAVTVPIGTLAALALVPNDPTVPGALFWSAWALTLGLLGGMAHDLLRAGAMRALKAQHLLMVAIAVICCGEVLQLYYVSYLDPDVIRKDLI